MEKEIWKDIPEYEGFYQASNFGRIKSMERFDSLNRKILEKILSPINRNRRYAKVTLCKNKIRKDLDIHRLIATTFLNHTPCGMKMVVNHINFDRFDNRLTNLEIVTNRENSNKKHILSSSKYVGVSINPSGKKWISRIWMDGRSRHLGSFSIEIEAHLAYEKELNKRIK